MPRFASLWQRGWLLFRGEPEKPLPFEIACGCGRLTTGLRQAAHQVLTCTGCGEKLFVLPLSRLPPVLTDAERAQQNTWVRRLRARLARLGPWQQPLLAAGLTFVLVAAALFLALRGLFPSNHRAPEDPAAIARHAQAGQRALSQGKFHIAARELAAAVSLRRRFPDALSLAERRKLTQLHRQADSLAERLTEPLEEILRRAADLTELDELEWQAAFRARYWGRPTLFEDELQRDGAGRIRLVGQTLSVRGQPVRLELSEVQLLRLLPLESPQRVLFAARLAAIHRERVGIWVVHWQPDSGVLVTDFGAAAACATMQPAEIRAIVERQAAWLAELP